MPRRLSDYDQPARAVRLGVLLARGERVTSALICSMFSVSRATAKRDMHMIEISLPVRAEVTAQKQVVLSLPKGYRPTIARFPDAVPTKTRQVD